MQRRKRGAKAFLWFRGVFMAGPKGVNEIRKDVVGRKTVITAVRGGRPHDHPPERAQKTVAIEKCYFCPGNEHLTPPEIDRIEKGGKWEVRCFPNKFPAFSQESKKAYGRHEVIVETPEHSKTLSELSEENLVDYLAMVKRRMDDAKKDPNLAYTCVFKNEGKLAGASLEHSHTQLVGMPFVPDSVKRLGKKAAKFSRLRKQSAKSVFAQNAHFFALCPKASRFHLESHIVPLMPAASLLELEGERLAALASILKSVLTAIDATSGYGPYNIVFHSCPHSGGAFPFHVQILPRLSTWAGFELGTEVVMLSEMPEDSAKALKAKLSSLNDKNAIS
jgi:UDPglucose--hexose-1-phosphate uridylyltransferase